LLGTDGKAEGSNPTEGFVKIKVKGMIFSMKYIDHGWEKRELKLAIIYLILKK